MTPDASTSTSTSTRTPYTPPVTPPASSAHTAPASASSQIQDGGRLTASVSGVSSAAQRLERSRALLQIALAPKSTSNKSTAVPPHQTSDGSSASRAGLTSIPAVALGLEAVKFWWSRHPLHLVGTHLAKTANTVMEPIAQRSPLTLVAGAFLVGGLLTWIRPWRLVLKPILFAGVMPQIASALVAQMTASAKKSAGRKKH